MDKEFVVDNYTKIGSVIFSTYLLLDLYHPNWYSFSSVGKYIIYLGAPFWLIGLYKTLPKLIKYYKKEYWS